ESLKKHRHHFGREWDSGCLVGRVDDEPSSAVPCLLQQSSAIDRDGEQGVMTITHCLLETCLIRKDGNKVLVVLRPEDQKTGLVVFLDADHINIRFGKERVPLWDYVLSPRFYLADTCSQVFLL